MSVRVTDTAGVLSDESAPPGLTLCAESVRRYLHREATRTRCLAPTAETRRVFEGVRGLAG